MGLLYLSLDVGALRQMESWEVTCLAFAGKAMETEQVDSLCLGGCPLVLGSGAAHKEESL